jgi:hypothetical protein
MPITVKSIVLWRKDIENQPGTLATTLDPFASGGANLEVVMGYRYPGNKAKAAIELYPVAGRKLVATAEAAGLKASTISTLLVQGDNKPGLGHRAGACRCENQSRFLCGAGNWQKILGSHRVRKR